MPVAEPFGARGLPFTRRPDPRCMRGLHSIYESASPLASDALAAALQRHFAGRLVESTEAWGPRSVRRLILQFRFELRLQGTRADLIFRQTCPPDERDALRDAFERALRASLGDVSG